MPHPLPPSIVLDDPLGEILEAASHALGELAGLGRAMPFPDLVARPFVRREAVTSSRIEGTRSDVADLYAYEAGRRPNSDPEHGQHGPSVADVQEVLNYVQAMEYGLERLATLPPGSDLMRELHTRLMAGVRGGGAAPGEWRDRQNWIGVPGSTAASASFVPPPVPEMHDALADLDRYLHTHDTRAALIRIALIHYQIEAIHPFRDGNGRIGRLMITLLLVHWRLLPLPLLYLSDYFEANRRAYHDGLLGVSQDGDWYGWVTFCLHGVREASRDAVDRARRLLSLRDRWREQLIAAGANTRSLRLVDWLFETPILTVPQAQRHLATTYNAAQRHVDRLVDAGILHQSRPTQPKLYEAPEILAIVADRT